MAGGLLGSLGGGVAKAAPRPSAPPSGGIGGAVSGGVQRAAPPSGITGAVAQGVNPNTAPGATVKGNISPLPFHGNKPGLALPSRDTLGGAWLVRMPGGHSAVLQQTGVTQAPGTIAATGLAMDKLGLGDASTTAPAGGTGTFWGRGVTATFLGNVPPPPPPPPVERMQGFGAPNPNITGRLPRLPRSSGASSTLAPRDSRVYANLPRLARALAQRV